MMTNLDRDGYLVVRNYLVHDALRAIQRAVAMFSHIQAEWITDHPSATGYFYSYSPLIAHKLGMWPHVQAIEQALTPPWVSALCREQLGLGWFTERVIVDYKEPGPEPLTGWHADQFPHHGRCLKTMLYLTDTDATNGAFSYVPGSQTWVRSLGTNDGQSMHTFEELLAQPHHHSDLLTSVCSHIRSSDQSDDHYSLAGPAGTLIVFDANGLHRGGVVSKGSRWLIRAHHRNLQLADVLSSKSNLAAAVQRLVYA